MRFLNYRGALETVPTCRDSQLPACVHPLEYTTEAKRVYVQISQTLKDQMKPCPGHKHVPTFASIQDAVLHTQSCLLDWGSFPIARQSPKARTKGMCRGLVPISWHQPWHRGCPALCNGQQSCGQCWVWGAPMLSTDSTAKGVVQPTSWPKQTRGQICP